MVGCFYIKIKVSVKVARCLKGFYCNQAAACSVDTAPASVPATDGYSSGSATQAARSIQKQAGGCYNAGRQ